MDAAADELLRLAFERAPAAEANEAISRMRDQEGDELSGASSYEFVLPDGDVRAWLLEYLLPRLVNHLESSGAKLPHCGGVFLSVFSGDTLHFLRAREVVELLSQWSGLSMAELQQRYGPK
ncbi:STAUR_1299 family protein [Archangium sp.]|uniref:STAUR_1299 family protein n=1 Tax=Archangium sp. TaxID=1872627 RepID=UPI00286ACBFB|nr:STAUR_1299 family protein [Archangium sp.]